MFHSRVWRLSLASWADCQHVSATGQATVSPWDQIPAEVQGTPQGWKRPARFSGHTRSPAWGHRAALPSMEPRLMRSNFLHRFISVLHSLAPFHLMLPPFSCCTLGQPGALRTSSLAGDGRWALARLCHGRGLALWDYHLRVWVDSSGLRERIFFPSAHWKVIAHSLSLNSLRLSSRWSQRAAGADPTPLHLCQSRDEGPCRPQGSAQAGAGIAFVPATAGLAPPPPRAPPPAAAAARAARATAVCLPRAGAALAERFPPPFVSRLFPFAGAAAAAQPLPRPPGRSSAVASSSQPRTARPGELSGAGAAGGAAAACGAEAGPGRGRAGRGVSAAVRTHARSRGSARAVRPRVSPAPAWEAAPCLPSQG